MTKPHLALTLGVAVLISSPGPAPAQETPDELKEKTVMITVNFRRGQPAEYGTGVLLCQENDRAWILTANHVFAGKSTEPWKQIRLSQIESATISFYRNYAPPIEADTSFLRKQMSFYTFKPEDLLLLSVPLSQQLPSTATLSPPPSDADEQGIVATGYWKDRGLTWEQVAGELAASRAGSTKFLYHTGEVHEGFSGGPVFNTLGELIGINIQRVPGEQTPNGEAGSWYGKAQTLNNQEVLAVIDKWVPAKCLESASQLGELAFFIYRKAMRAVSTRRWAQAEELMRQAIEQKPVEGGSVHLEGMRYTNYLPRYHLGLALFKQEKYSDAIREWDRSESQGVIREDKRYKDLKRRRVRAYEELRRQAQAAAAAGQPTLEEAAKAAFEKKEAEKAAAAKAAAEKAAAEKAAAERAAAAKAAAEKAAAEKAAAEKAAAEQAAREKLPTHRVAGTARPCLNLREEPSLRAGRLDCLEPGMAVKQLGRDDDWSRVRLEDGREGWVSSRRLEPIEATGDR